MFISDKVYCKKSRLCDGKGVFAKEDIRSGVRLLEFSGEVIIGHGNDHTLQIDVEKHLGPTGSIDDYVNHSCEPNCYIRFDDLSLITRRQIQADEELSFHYCTTEYDLGGSSFYCVCGSKYCLKEIKGFKYLPENWRRYLRPFLFPYLLGDPIPRP